MLNVWTFGAPMVIFLAGLRQIPAMYYEAASVDGAGRWRQFWSITLPLLTPIIFFNLVLQIIHAFQAFTQAFVVSGGTGGPADSTHVLHAVPLPEGLRTASTWATPRRWPGCCWSSSRVFTAINFCASKYWVFYDD